MRSIWALARQVVADAAHERVFWTAPLYALVVLTLAPLVSDATLAGGRRAVLDLGWLGFWLVACLLGCRMGIRAVGVDLHQRTAALLLYRPLSIPSWLTGRLLGVLLTLGVQIAIMAALWACVATLWGGAISANWGWAVLLIWAEAALIAAMGALLSSLVTPVFAGACTCALWIAGHLSTEYARVAIASDIGWVSAVVFTVIPDLDRFNVQDALVHGLNIPTAAALGSLAYAAVWIAVLQALTVLVVSRRDLA